MKMISYCVGSNKLTDSDIGETHCLQCRAEKTGVINDSFVKTEESVGRFG